MPDGSQAPLRVTGWLLILTRLLIVAQPLYVAIVASRSFNAMAVRGRPVVLVLILRLLVAAFGVGAGMALANRRPGSARLARLAILAAAATHVFVYTTPYFPNNLAPGDAPFVLGAWLAFYGGWLVYLSRSRQVRAITD